MLKQLSFKTITVFILVITSFLGGMWVYEVKVARPALSYMGVPEGQHDLENLVHILRNRAYLVGYSEWLGNPLWVTYKIIPKQFNHIGRRPHFRADWRSPFPVEPEDYRHSHYDRGHMAPNYLIASRYGREAQKETFLMTNITPQRGRLNQKTWQRLEEVAADYFSKWYPEIWVITGPIFDPHPPRFKHHPRIAIPKAFYKIFIRPGTPQDPTPKMLAFIMPQTASTKASLMKFVVSVDAVEAATGLDFNSELPDAIENRVEAQIHPEQWHLKRVAKLRARY